jgi:hypothetical protein
VAIVIRKRWKEAKQPEIPGDRVPTGMLQEDLDMTFFHSMDLTNIIQIQR